MPLPPIPSEEQVHPQFKTEDAFSRREVLRSTDRFFSNPENTRQAYEHAASNLASSSKDEARAPGVIQVVEGDWGTTTQELTKLYGKTFAVLNMAHSGVPGGGCDDGLIAQEENLTRRTNLRRHVEESELSEMNPRRYNSAMTKIINGEVDRDGNPAQLDPQGNTTARVFLSKTPLVCIKGPELVENGKGTGKGYQNLDDKDIFAFYELRSAAQDLRPIKRPDGTIFTPVFNEELARQKIAAQLQTLIEGEQRNVVLSAFGCGAFGNPPEVIARIYKEEFAKRPGAFDNVVFAIFNAGYGPKTNYQVFKGILDNQPLSRRAVAPAAPQVVGADAAAAAPARSEAPQASPAAASLNITHTIHYAPPTGGEDFKSARVLATPEANGREIVKLHNGTGVEFIKKSPTKQPGFAQIKFLDANQKIQIGWIAEKNYKPAADKVKEPLLHSAMQKPQPEVAFAPTHKIRYSGDEGYTSARVLTSPDAKSAIVKILDNDTPIKIVGKSSGNPGFLRVHFLDADQKLQKGWIAAKNVVKLSQPKPHL